MNDYSELKRAASAAKNWGGEVGEQRWYLAECFKSPYFSAQDAEFIAACDPGQVLALIADNERLERETERVNASWHGMKRDLDQLKAENEALLENPGDAL